MAEKPTYDELEQRVKELEKTELKRQIALDALRESEERYRLLVTSYDHPLTVYDSDGIIFLMNTVGARESRLVA